jgi:hypothetical protein
MNVCPNCRCNLKTGEKQITFGRFVDEHGNQIARDVVKRL